MFSPLLWQLPALENQYSDTIQTNHCHLIASVKYHHASAKTFVCNNVSSNKQLAKTDLAIDTIPNYRPIKVAKYIFNTFVLNYIMS